MADVIVCGRCGARSWAGATSCYACGSSLASNGQAVIPPGQPPTPYASVPPAFTAAPTPGAPAAPPQFAAPYPPAVAAPQYAPLGAPPQYAPPGAPPVVPPPWPGAGGAPQPSPFGQSGAQPAPPWNGATGPYGAPPAGYQVGSPAVTSAARPFGISVLAVVEVVIGLVGLYVALDLFGWANWATSYGDNGEVAVDFIMGVAYFATSIAVFDLARSLWAMQQWAWGRACLLSLVLIGLIAISLYLWGFDTSDLVGVVVHGSILAYLNTRAVRALFGRPPAAFF